MSKVLLTGATGFIGSALIDYLELNMPSMLNELVVLSSVQHPKLDTLLYNVETYSTPKIENVSAVIHLGAFTPKSNFNSNDIDKCFSNIYFTKNFLESLPTTVSKFVFASTLDVYQTSNTCVNKVSTSHIDL